MELAEPSPSPFGPYWWWQKRQHDMRVTDLAPKMVVFLGHKGIKGDAIVQLDGTHDFVPDGRFIFVMESYGQSFPYIVTEKHVIDQATGDKRELDIYIRVNLIAGGVRYIKTKPTQWLSHPDHVDQGRKRKYIDVAVLPLIDAQKKEWFDYQEWDFTVLVEENACTEDVIKRYDIGLGDEVAIPGLFQSHIGVERNVPVLRLYVPDGPPQILGDDTLHGLARAPPTHPPPA
jgi:hypothetical protein